MTGDSAIRKPQIVLRAIGLCCLVFALLGSMYNISGITRTLSDSTADPTKPYFPQIFCIVSGIFVIFYLFMAFVGIQLVRTRTKCVPLFAKLIFLELMYFFAMPFSGERDSLGWSVSMATMMAAGGLMFQFYVLFPLWGPPLALWAKRHWETPSSSVWHDRFPSESTIYKGEWSHGIAVFLVVYFLLWVLQGLIWKQLGDTEVLSNLFIKPLAAVVAGANVVLSFKSRRKQRRIAIAQHVSRQLALGVCPWCEYNLRALQDPRCPECGMSFDPTMLGNHAA